VAWLRAALMVALVVTSVLLELVVVPWFHLPGATPDVVTVTVVALGMVGGPVRGAVAGFGAGLLLDLVPPSAGLVGITAVVLVGVGYAAGLLGQEGNRAPLVQVGLAGLLAGAAVLGQALVGTVVGYDRVAWDRVPLMLGTQIVYALVLAAFVVPLVTWLWRRVTPSGPRYDLVRP
jgi:rod shape-determining protein MreD